MNEGRELLVRLAPLGAPNDVQAILPESVRTAVLVSVTGTFQAGVAIENRAIELRWLDKDGNLKGFAEAIDLQNPSTDVAYVWGLSGTAYVGGVTLTQHVPFAMMVAQGGDLIRLRDSNDASLTDTWVNPVAFFRDVTFMRVGVE